MHGWIPCDAKLCNLLLRRRCESLALCRVSVERYHWRGCAGWKSYLDVVRQKVLPIPTVIPQGAPGIDILPNFCQSSSAPRNTCQLLTAGDGRSNIMPFSIELPPSVFPMVRCCCTFVAPVRASFGTVVMFQSYTVFMVSPIHRCSIAAHSLWSLD